MDSEKTPPPPTFKKEDRVRVKGTDLTGWIDATVLDAKREGRYFYRLELPGFTRYERSGCRYEESELEPAPNADSIFAKFAQSAEARERLSAISEVQVDESIRLWFRRVHTGPGDRTKAEALLGDLYESIGRRRPVVIWCPSPVQCITLPWLYFNLIRSGAWLDCFENFLSESSTDAPSFDERWNELWQRSGDSALAEMHDRCRTRVEPEMESLLIAQLRDEVKLALLSKTLVAAHALPDKLRFGNETWKTEMINEPLQFQEAVRLQCRELFSLLFRANRDWKGWDWVERGYGMFQGDSPRDATLIRLWVCGVAMRRRPLTDGLLILKRQSWPSLRSFFNQCRTDLTKIFGNTFVYGWV
ncbi:hypothetical protein KF728_07165 [Candidatus Obscuribacterales bacterium]|nr:hypothetical protein [Candidatus Obscuribacterales bacterium]